MSEHPADGGNIHAIAITFRRLDTLAETLQAFLSQTRRPDSVLIVDNDADPAVESFAHSLEGVAYLAMPENLGPAGAVAAGMTEVLRTAAPSDWILLIDDDDPPLFDSAVAELYSAARVAPDDVAAIGLTGSRYNVRTGLMERVPDERLEQWTDVDMIGSNQVPLYRAAALRDVGVFDPGMFIFFEELEFGLRLRQRGWRLVITRDITLRTRLVSGRTGLGVHAASVRRSGGWRSYYVARNEVLLARRFGHSTTPLTVSARLVAGGTAKAVRSRSLSVLGPRLSGIADGWRGRSGRTRDPG